MSFKTPIAFCIFNRPDHVDVVFRELKRLKPEKLFVFSDGPRQKHPDDERRIAESRAIIDQIDWDCDLQQNYSDVNLGCKRRVSSGISWAFESTDELIVLEDDCLPHPSFFRYCESLLEKFRDDERVMVVSGDNFQARRRSEYSYYFSKYPHCWGWATWKRAWQKLDLELQHWPELKATGWLNEIVDVPDEVACWEQIFDLQHAGKINSWAFPWMYSCWLHSGLTVLPEVNLISNIGFDQHATHTDRESQLANLPTFDIGLIDHPPYVHRSKSADIYSFYRLFFEPVRSRRLSKRIRNALRFRENFNRWQYQKKCA